MERFLLLAVISALAVAKPEMYREKEDFQYSRSSSDEGSKAGFYGAQRGNMGGNFERAHNMDGLAQHQMSGLVRQVQGELGEGSKTRTGSVFTAANSKGVYGSGNYDLSNLEGRNFQEGVSFDDSQALSSLSSQAGYNTQSSASSNNGAYIASDSQSSRYHSGYNGYSGQSSRRSGHTYDNSGQSLGYTAQAANTQELDGTRGVRRYDYGGQEASGYYSQSGYHGQSSYDHSHTNSQSSSDYGANTHSRHTSAMPVRVVIRPGTRVPVPIATQSLNTGHTGTTYDQNSVNSDAEILINQNQPITYKPVGQAKHYESAYSYHKEWEKHDTKPVVVPTESPFPKNSELYEDTQAHVTGQQYDATATDSQNSHSSNVYGGYSSNVKSASSNQHRHEFNTNEEQNKAASSSSSNTNTYAGYNSGVNTDVNNQIEHADNKPKSYQSSYSYHKSWERQGDPYVIKPVGSVNVAQESQKLTAASGNQGTWSSHQYGSRSQKNRQYYLNAEDCDCEEDSHTRVARSYNTNQYQQTIFDNAEETGQQVENLAQQTQSKWGNLEDLGQQTQDKWDKLEQTGQQSENQWSNLETLGQQTQSKWGNLEDLGQQTQNKWDKLEQTGQQSENQWSNLETLGQQTQNQWDNAGDAGQQTQNKWDKLEDLNQQTQNQWNTFGEQTRPQDVEQETQNAWIVQPHSAVKPDATQQIQNTWLTQSEFPVNHDLNQPMHNTKPAQSEIPMTLNQQTQNTWMSPSEAAVARNLNQQTQNNWIGQSDTEVQDDQKPLNNGNIIKPSNQEITDVPSGNDFHSNVDINKPYFSNPFLLTPANSEKPENVDTKISEETTKPKENFDGNNFNMHFNNRPFLPPSAFNVPLSNHFNYAPKQDSDFYSTFGNTKPWGHEQYHTYFNQQSQTYSNNWNSYEQFHRQSDWPKQDSFKLTENNFNSQTSASTPALSKLWDKIDTIDKQFSGNNDDQPSLTDTQTKYVNFNQYPTEYFSNNPYGSSNTDHWHSTVLEEQTRKPNSNNDKILKTNTGRGDIGPEEDVDQTIKSTEKILEEPAYKPDKTLAEIELLSQTLHTNKTPNQQQTDSPITIIREHKDQHSTVKPTSTSSPHLTNSYSAIIPVINYEKITEKTQLTSDSSTGYSLQTGKNDENPDKLDSGKTIKHHAEDFIGRSNDQQNTEQLFLDFGQQNTEQQFENIDQQSPTLEQQNTEQQFQNFGQQIPTLKQQNTEQQFENFASQNQPLEQRNIEKVENSRQQNLTLKPQSTVAQLETTAQQSSTLEQQNTEQQFENFEQQSSTLEQKNTEQQFEIFAQQNQPLDQQNTEEFEKFGQQNLTLKPQNTEQHFKNFDLPSSNLEQPNTEQHFENFDQNQPLEPQSTDQQFENFGNKASSNLEQQNTEQHFEIFDQNQPLEQQNTDQQFENFGNKASSNLEQQNTEQHFEIFEQSQPLEQQNTDQQFENFGQASSNLEQQNTEQQFENFGQQSQTLEQFGIFDNQSPSVGEQNMEQFGQHGPSRGMESENIEHKIESLGHSKDNNEQQNIGQQFENFDQRSVNHQQPNNNEQQFSRSNNERYGNNPQPVQIAKQTDDLSIIPLNELENRRRDENSENKYSQNDNKQSFENDKSSLTSTEIPLEVTTEKTGFWKNVGNKFVSAKDKVFSWFQGS